MEAQEMIRISQTVASLYRQRGCWWMDLEDATQEAAASVVKAMQTFEATGGQAAHGEPEGYAWKTAVFSLKKYLWKESSPVSGGKEKMAGLVRVPVSRRDSGTQASPEGAVSEAVWAQQVRRVLGAELSDMPLGELAVQIIAGNATTAQVAQATGLEKEVLYRLREKAANRLRRSRALRDLFEEQP